MGLSTWIFAIGPDALTPQHGVDNGCDGRLDEGVDVRSRAASADSEAWAAAKTAQLATPTMQRLFALPTSLVCDRTFVTERQVLGDVRRAVRQRRRQRHAHAVAEDVAGAVITATARVALHTISMHALARRMQLLAGGSGREWVRVPVGVLAGSMAMGALVGRLQSAVAASFRTAWRNLQLSKSRELRRQNALRRAAMGGRQRPRRRPWRWAALAAAGTNALVGLAALAGVAVMRNSTALWVFGSTSGRFGPSSASRALRLAVGGHPHAGASFLAGALASLAAIAGGALVRRLFPLLNEPPRPVAAVSRRDSTGENPGAIVDAATGQLVLLERFLVAVGGRPLGGSWMHPPAVLWPSANTLSTPVSRQSLSRLAAPVRVLPSLSAHLRWLTRRATRGLAAPVERARQEDARTATVRSARRLLVRAQRGSVVTDPVKPPPSILRTHWPHLAVTTAAALAVRPLVYPVSALELSVLVSPFGDGVWRGGGAVEWALLAGETAVCFAVLELSWHATRAVHRVLCLVMPWASG